MWPHCVRKLTESLLKQVALGEEIESDRYLITIEESLNHPSSNDTRGVTLNTVEDKGVKGAGFLYQPGKRKRQVCGAFCFLVHVINSNTIIIYNIKVFIIKCYLFQ